MHKDCRIVHNRNCAQNTCARAQEDCAQYTCDGDSKVRTTHLRGSGRLLTLFGRHGYCLAQIDVYQAILGIETTEKGWHGACMYPGATNPVASITR